MVSFVGSAGRWEIGSVLLDAGFAPWVWTDGDIRHAGQLEIGPFVTYTTGTGTGIWYPEAGNWRTNQCIVTVYIIIFLIFLLRDGMDIKDTTKSLHKPGGSIFSKLYNRLLFLPNDAANCHAALQLGSSRIRIAIYTGHGMALGTASRRPHRCLETASLLYSTATPPYIPSCLVSA